MLTDATCNAMLDAVVFDLVSLHTAYSLTGANEVTGGSPAYARKAITMAAAVSRARASSSAPVFDVPAGTTVRFVGYWTNAGTVFRGMVPCGGIEKGFQVDTTTNERIICEAHGYANGDAVVFINGTPPGGLVEGTVYFVVNSTLGDPDYFQVSATSGGAAINLTSEPSGACKVSKVVPEVFAAQGTYTISALNIALTE